MGNGHKLDMQKLEKKVTALSNALAKLSSKDDFLELIRILRFPGWTTPAEFIFASSIVDSMLAHTNALAEQRSRLLEGSKAVTAGK